MSLDQARRVADAVLYEGYLLYPYRSTSRKNQVRWQFGVLGPPQAAEQGLGEDPRLATECLVRVAGDTVVTVDLRFLQLQVRSVESRADDDTFGFVETQELRVGEDTYVGWDEAVERELALGPFSSADLAEGRTVAVKVPGERTIEEIHDSGELVGRVVRRRWPLAAAVRLSMTPVEDTLLRLSVAIDNTALLEASSRDEAMRHSLIGAHLLLQCRRAEFLSLLEPPDHARVAAAACTQHRCFPVLGGEPGDHDVVLVSPIILYDYPEVAEQSPGALFDSTEIDEILTLRVMTLTEQEKAEARATDPRAAEIIDRCEQMPAETLQAMHGVLRDPHLGDSTQGDTLPEVPAFAETPWWHPEAEASVQPDQDTVIIAGVPVARGCQVRVHPSRQADAQDLFFAGRTATVASVHFDVDGSTHVAVTMDDDPAADLHQWYGRYLYFAPDELEPLARSGHSANQRKED